MKKIILIALSLLALPVISCRQEDDVLSQQDATTLKAVQNSAKNSNLNSSVLTSGTNTKTNDINVNPTLSVTVDGEIVAPPRK